MQSICIAEPKKRYDTDAKHAVLANFRSEFFDKEIDTNTTLWLSLVIARHSEYEAKKHPEISKKLVTGILTWSADKKRGVDSACQFAEEGQYILTGKQFEDGVIALGGKLKPDGYLGSGIVDLLLKPSAGITYEGTLNITRLDRDNGYQPYTHKLTFKPDSYKNPSSTH